MMHFYHHQHHLEQSTGEVNAFLKISKVRISINNLNYEHFDEYFAFIH